MFTVFEGLTLATDRIAKLDCYFAGNTNQPLERNKFRAMRQESSESIAHFVSWLRGLAGFWDLGHTRNTQVWDQIIEGFLPSKLRLKFLQKGNELSSDVALQMSSCYEAVAQQASAMQADNITKIDFKSGSYKDGWSITTEEHFPPTWDLYTSRRMISSIQSSIVSLQILWLSKCRTSW